MTNRPVSATLARHQEQLIWQRALRRLEGPPSVAAASGAKATPPSQKPAPRRRVTTVTAAAAIAPHLDIDRT